MQLSHMISHLQSIHVWQSNLSTSRMVKLADFFGPCLFGFVSILYQILVFYFFVNYIGLIFLFSIFFKTEGSISIAVFQLCPAHSLRTLIITIHTYAHKKMFDWHAVGAAMHTFIVHMNANKNITHELKLFFLYLSY